MFARVGYDKRTGEPTPVCPSSNRPFPAGRPAGARSDPLTKLFAVYLDEGRDPAPDVTPTVPGGPTPRHALLGLCRDPFKAARIAAKIRRASRSAVRQGLRPQEALIGWAAYDPYHFIPPSDRTQLTRREAHRRAMTGAAARRAELGLA